MIRLNDDYEGPRVPRFKLRELSPYELALVEVYGVDGQAVGRIVDGWVEDLLEGTDLNRGEVTLEAHEIVHQAAERKVSAAALLEELNQHFRKLELIK